MTDIKALVERALPCDPRLRLCEPDHEYHEPDCSAHCRPAVEKAMREAVDEEQARWQNSIEDECGIEMRHGLGCESGDGLDVAIAAIKWSQEARAEAVEEARRPLVEASANVSRNTLMALLAAHWVNIEARVNGDLRTFQADWMRDVAKALLDAEAQAKEGT